jgi:hypothetical protein
MATTANKPSGKPTGKPPGKPTGKPPGKTSAKTSAKTSKNTNAKQKGSSVSASSLCIIIMYSLCMAFVLNSGIGFVDKHPEILKAAL